MLNKVFQNFVYQVEEIVRNEFGITDNSGIIIACTDESKIGQKVSIVANFIKNDENSKVIEGFSFEKVFYKGKFEFTVFLNSGSQEYANYLSLISISIKNIKTNYDERFDRNNFIKGILTNNMSIEDIALRSKELHLLNSSCRVVFLIRTNQAKDMYIHEVIQSLFPNNSKDFVVVIDDQNTVLVKELKTGSDAKEIEKTAMIIVDTLTTELMVKSFVGIGSVVDNLLELGQSYNEALIALTVGKIFENDKSAVNYNSLGIGRLIYQLPVEPCRLFLKEIFKGESLETVDNETAFTILKFFENNLNISEASRQLYVHRNTLVYRLDKIQKLTGLDLRRFDDAIMFKMAMLVNKYIESAEH